MNAFEPWLNGTDNINKNNQKKKKIESNIYTQIGALTRMLKLKQRNLHFFALEIDSLSAEWIFPGHWVALQQKTNLHLDDDCHRNPIHNLLIC